MTNTERRRTVTAEDLANVAVFAALTAALSVLPEGSGCRIRLIWIGYGCSEEREMGGNLIGLVALK